MPAIQPAQLKFKSVELIQYATAPRDFCRAYHEFLDYYADRTYRPGQVAEPPPLIRAYHVPQPVLRVVEKEMKLFASNNREAALEVADALWLEPYFEFRLLAASVVGQVSPVPISSVIQRVETWAEPSTEDRLINALVNSGLARVLIEHPDIYLQQIEIWLSSNKIHITQLGLKAIPPLLESGEFEDYPLLFNQLSKLMRGGVNPLKADIIAVIAGLASRSPEETAYFLGQAKKSASESPNISWYIRNSLANFSPESQIYLRKVMLEDE